MGPNVPAATAGGAILFMGAGTDAGGIVIRFVGGKVKIEKVPGWEARVRSEILAAVNIIQQAATIQDVRVREQFEQFAEGVIQGRSSELQQYMQQISSSGDGGPLTYSK